MAMMMTMTLDDLRCPGCGSPLRDCRFDVCRACGEEGVFGSGVTGSAPAWYRRYTGGWLRRYVRTLGRMALDPGRFFTALREIPIGTGATRNWFIATVFLWTLVLLALTMGFDALEFGLLWGQSKAALAIPPATGFSVSFEPLMNEATAVLSHGWLVLAGQWLLCGLILWVVAGASLAEKDLEEVFAVWAVLCGIEIPVLIGTAGWRTVDVVSVQAGGVAVMSWLPVAALAMRAAAGGWMFAAMRRTYRLGWIWSVAGVLIYLAGSLGMMWRFGLAGYGWGSAIDPAWG